MYVPQVQEALIGPQGEQGRPGEQGIQGEVGPLGVIGIQGETGDVGSRGPIGLTGEQGATGAIGTTGVQGIQGVKGDTGDTGPIGPLGFGELIHDSGWKAVGKGKDLTICTLEDPNIFVYMIGRNYYWSGHQADYGGDISFSQNDAIIEGASWFIEHQSSDWLDYPHTLKVHRFSDDWEYPEVRVLVWQLPPPETLLLEMAPIDDDPFSIP